MRTMSTRMTRPLVAGLVLAVLPFAQESAPRIRLSLLGRDDAAFARALYDKGLFDLAQDACDTILSQETSGKLEFDEILETKALVLDLELEGVRREPDLIQRKTAIQAVLEKKNQLIAENSRTQVAENVRGSLPEIYMLLGETLVAALEGERDPSAGVKLREEGDVTFAQAEDSVRQRIRRFEVQKDEGGPLASYAERQHLLATWNLGRTLYFHGLLYPKGDPERAKYFEECVDVFSELSLDYPDVLPAYQGYIFQGLCHGDLGEIDTAIEDFDAAIALRETWGLDEASGLWSVPQDAADVISAAFYQEVLLLSGADRHGEAEAAAEDFYTSIPDPYLTSQGFAVVAAHADSRLKAGDLAKAGELAQLLIEKNPQGPGGSRGRELLARMVGSGSGPQLGPERLVRVAETLRAQGEIVRARALCRIALRQAQDIPEFAEAGAQACALLGAIYANENRLYEASIAFDLASELFPGQPTTPEALWRAIDCYNVLFAREKRPFFEKRMQERVRILSTKYSSHPRATWAILIQGSQFENEGDFLKAAQLYLDVSPSSSVYQEAESRAARCYYRQARAAKDKAESERLRGETERLLRKTLVDVDQAIERTLDSQVQAQLATTRFGALQTLGTLLLETDRPAEATTLLAGLEVGGDDEKAQAVWGMRIRALQAQGKVEEAEALFESLIRSNPNSPAIAATAGVLARGIDQRATDLAAKDRRGARELWAKAAYYYDLSIQPQLEGRIVDPDEIQTIGARLYSIGFELNDVPETVQTFVDWSEKPKSPQIFERAAAIHERLLDQAPSYRSEIQLGRCLGLLGRWAEAASVYARLFDTEALVEPGGKGFNQQLLRVKHELLNAYLEWGVAEHMLALSDGSQDRLKRAEAIFEKLAAPGNLEKKSRLWWGTKFYQARAMYDRGEYANADFVLRDIKREHPNFDQGEFGYQPRLAALEADLAKKPK